MNPPKSNESILFVTGRLAENSLRKIVGDMQAQANFTAQIQVLPISVAALMTTDWVLKNIDVPKGIDRVILPGFCTGDLSKFAKVTTAVVEVGPKDLRFLPDFFGQQHEQPSLDEFDIEIIAEINHAPRLSRQEILKTASNYAASGADVIDVGCEVDWVWTQVGECVRAIKDLGLRVSVDSLVPEEIQLATAAGAELVLSVNSSNIHAAEDFGAEVVLIPDDVNAIDQLQSNIEFLENRSIRFRVDPIVEPIGTGFFKSLQRYAFFRDNWPEIPMMMGVGNISEMTEVDSAGINLLLMAICQELKIHSVLTTEVISWARSSVKECDIARRMIRYSLANETPPKHLDSRLVSLRDPKVVDLGFESIHEIASQIRDFNYRIFADSGEIHLIGGGHHLHGTDPFQLFDQLAELDPANLTPSHSFYLGYELNKAAIALQLGKQYSQDEALNWGHLTIAEQNRHRLSRRNKTR